MMITKNALRFFVRGTATSTKRSRLDDLRDATAHLVTKPDITSEDRLPSGFSQLFHDSVNETLISIHSRNAKSSQLSKMLSALKTPEEYESFMKTFKMYRDSKLLLAKTFSAEMIQKMINLEKFDELFALLCNKYRYGIIPTGESIAEIMRHYSNIGVTETYKAYTLLLYYSIEPTAEHYAILIQAGLKAGTKDALEMSEITLKEAKALRLSVDENIAKKLVDALQNMK